MRSLLDRIIPQVHIRFVGLVLVFVLCPVIEAACALPALSVAEETTILVDESMTNPMEGMMCSPLATSSDFSY
jgi:hypothetical protein